MAGTVPPFPHFCFEAATMACNTDGCNIAPEYGCDWCNIELAPEAITVEAGVGILPWLVIAGVAGFMVFGSKK